MSDHSRALVPLESWSYSSPELRASGRTVHVCLMAEALLYYEAILMNVSNQPQFAELLKWFAERGLYNELLALVRGGTIPFYDYSFSTTAVIIAGDYSLWHIQDELQAQPNSFERRFLYHPDIQRVLGNVRLRKKLYEAFRGHVIEAKSDDFGAAIENARGDFKDCRRNALIVQAFVDKLYRFRGLGRPPEITATIVPKADGTGDRLTWNVNFDQLAQLAGQALNFNPGTPLTAGAHCNRQLMSAAKERCDLFLGQPMSSLVGDKLYETVRTTVRLNETVEQLKAEVEFPDIRRLVNSGDLKFEDVLTIRKRAAKFREWLQSGADRDRNAIVAYHHEVARDSGLTRTGRTTLSLFGIVGGGAAGSVIGTVVAGPVGGAIGGAVGSGLTYLLDLASRIG